MRRLTVYLLASFLLLSAVSCKAAPTPEGQKKFGDDAEYFIGLRLLKEGDENAAREKFKYCIKKGSPAIAQKSAEALCTIGNIQEKNAAAENLLKLFRETRRFSLLPASSLLRVKSTSSFITQRTWTFPPQKTKLSDSAWRQWAAAATPATNPRSTAGSPSAPFPPTTTSSTATFTSTPTLKVPTKIPVLSSPLR